MRTMRTAPWCWSWGSGGLPLSWGSLGRRRSPPASRIALRVAALRRQLSVSGRYVGAVAAGGMLRLDLLTRLMEMSSTLDSLGSAWRGGMH